MNIEQKLLTPNKYSRPGKKLIAVKGVVIHWLANPNSSALMNRNYFESLKDQTSRYASAHYIIGLKGEIIQCVPDNEVAYHVGSKTYTARTIKEFNSYPNGYMLGIECAHIDWQGTMTKETYNSLVELTTYLCKKYNLDPLVNVWTHQEVVGWKDCHRWFVNHPDEWNKFKNLVHSNIQVPLQIQNKNGIATILVNTLNIRKTPNGEIIRTANQGAKYQITGITNDGWYRLAYDGGEAYISTNPQYVSFSSDIGGLIKMQDIDINELKKALKIPDAGWAVGEIQKAKQNGIIVSDHDPNELVTFGVMITVMNNIYDQLKRKGSL